MQNDRRIDDAIKILIDQDFALTCLIYDTKYIYDDNIPTMCVTIFRNKIHIRINPSFIDSLSESEIAGVLYHEFSHYFLGHLLPKNWADMRIVFDNDDAISTAHELEINGNIVPLNILPEDRTSYDKLGLPADKSRIEYLKLLKENPQKIQPSMIINIILGELTEEELKNLENNPNAQEIMRKILEEHIEKIKLAAKVAGSKTSNLARNIEKVEAKIAWKNHINKMLRLKLSQKDDRSWASQNRRSSNLPGQMRKANKPDLYILVDVSGSISKELLSQFFAEIDRIAFLAKEVVVITVDTEIHEEFIYKRGQLPKIHGGGGTNFDKAFEHLKEKKTNLNLVVLTDGFVSVPEIKLHGFVLWCIDEKGNTKLEVPDHKIIIG